MIFFRGCTIALLLFAATSARADEARAKDLLQWGQAAFDVGRYVEAAQAFNEAYVETKRPRLLWSIANCYRKQFDIDHDVAGLRRAQVGFQRYAELATGKEKIEAAASAQEVATLLAQIARTEEKQRADAAAAAAPKIVERKPGSRAPGAVLAAIGLLLGGGGLTLSLLAADASSTVQNGGRTTPAQFGSVADTDARGRLYDTLSFVAYGVGAAAFVVGVALFVARPSRRAATASAWILPSPGGALVRF